MIDKKKQSLLDRLPAIIEYNDDLISIRTYKNWVGENGIKYKRIKNIEDPNDNMYLIYLTKDSTFTIENLKCIGYITCMTGKIELIVDGVTTILDVYEKTSLIDKEIKGRAIENTFLIASLH